MGDREQLGQINGLGDLKGISTIWEFDERITAPLHGFRDAEDYYSKCSSMGFIDAIRTDTLLIQSQDDPLIPAFSVPRVDRLAPHIEMHLSNRGGHVGFICGNRSNWLEHKILNFIVA